jgi:hypothetical protein
MTDADRQPAPIDLERGECAVVSRNQFACRPEECQPFDGQADVPGRALQQASAQLVFEPAQLEADRGLGGPQHVGGAGEALQVGGQDEGLDRIDIHCLHFEDQDWK